MAAAHQGFEREIEGEKRARKTAKTGKNRV